MKPLHGTAPTAPAGDPSDLPSPGVDPPLVPGIPVLGNARDILRDTGAFLTHAYQKFGPVFRTRVLWNSYTVIAGPAARDFIRDRLDEKYCSRHSFFSAIEREFGGADLTLAHSGERHSRLRNPLALAFSRQVASPFVPDFIDAARRTAIGSPPASSLRVMDAMKRIAFDQFVRAMAGTASDRLSFRDCLLVSEIGMNVGGRILPAAAFHLPWYRRAHTRSFRILRQIVAERANAPTDFADSRPTIIDTLLSAKDSSGKAITGDEAVTYAAYGIAASVAYVARLTGFMLYEILHRPDLQSQVTAECDAAFARGLTDASGVRGLPLLRAVFQETLRFHPISPGMPYTAAHDFTFLGHRIRNGETLVISPVPLAFSTCPFHQPDKFDPARFEEPRMEHRNGEGFFPFGLGHRSCIATGLVELMAVTAIAALLHGHSLSLDPPGYQLRLVIRPLPSPDRKFRVRAAPRTPPSEPVEPASSEESTFSLFPGYDHPTVAETLRTSPSRKFPPGAPIIRQGDLADAFYVITHGSVRISTGSGASAKVLAELSPGDCFGEIGLLQNAPRNADVTSGPAGVTTLVLDRDAFLAIVASTDLVAEEIGSLARRRCAEIVLHQIAPSLDTATAAKLLPEFELRSYPPGETLIREGDPADHFFILTNGSARVTRKSPDGVERDIATLGDGDYFGETGLLNGTPRNASVTIAGDHPATVLVTGRRGLDIFLQSTRSPIGQELATAMLARLDPMSPL